MHEEGGGALCVLDLAVMGEKDVPISDIDLTIRIMTDAKDPSPGLFWTDLIEEVSAVVIDGGAFLWPDDAFGDESPVGMGAGDEGERNIVIEIHDLFVIDAGILEHGEEDVLGEDHDHALNKDIVSPFGAGYDPGSWKVGGLEKSEEIGEMDIHGGIDSDDIIGDVVKIGEGSKVHLDGVQEFLRHKWIVAVAIIHDFIDHERRQRRHGLIRQIRLL